MAIRSGYAAAGAEVGEDVGWPLPIVAQALAQALDVGGMCLGSP